MAGYELTEKLVGGVGATIMYFRYKYYDINAAYYGGRAFMMYNVIPVVNIIGEFEAVNVEGIGIEATMAGLGPGALPTHNRSAKVY